MQSFKSEVYDVERSQTKNLLDTWNIGRFNTNMVIPSSVFKKNQALIKAANNGDATAKAELRGFGKKYLPKMSNPNLIAAVTGKAFILN